jgi:predicted peptidase
MKQFTRDFFRWLPQRDSVHDARFSLPSEKDNRSLGLQDGVKALEYVRENAGEYGIDHGKIGIMGFSAGAGVTMNAVLNASPGNRPDFAASIYGGWKKGPVFRKMDRRFLSWLRPMTGLFPAALNYTSPG